jgi:small subunit ribosomal protein S7
MRGKQAKNRQPGPDPKYQSPLVSRFMNYIMQDGKKSVAQGLVYKALDSLADKTKLPQMEAFEKALENARPKIELRSRRVGGANYQVPVPVTDSRSRALAMRWIITAARNGKGSKDMGESLGLQLLNAFNKEGPAIKKREEVHKMAEANKAFSHLSW